MSALKIYLIRSFQAGTFPSVIIRMQTLKLEEMEKKAGNAEGQVGDLARRLLLLEENAVKSEERLAGIVTNLAGASHGADKSVKDQHEISQV